MTNLISSGLYLLREREFIKSNETIYKIGRSDDVMKRVNQYPNGSMVYLIIGCNDNAIHESNLIEIFNNKFANEKYVGNEYFKGDMFLMKETMLEYMKSKQNNFYIIDEELIIERVNKENNLCIPRVEQNIHNIKEIIKNIVSMEEDKGDGRANDKDLNSEDSVEENKLTNEVVQDIVIAGDNNGNGSNINANNSNITINITNNNITNTIDNVCNRCGIGFKYPYLLVRHLNGKKLCKLKELCDTSCICKYCSIQYSNKYNLLRHFKVCKLKKQSENNTEEDENKNEEDINEEDINEENINEENINEENILDNYQQAENLNEIKSIKIIDLISKIVDKSENIQNSDIIINDLVQCLKKEN